MTIFDELNAAQRTSVLDDSPLQVVRAGPGSGKTRALIARLRRLDAAGRRVLALTFTRKAAEEMRARAHAESPPRHAIISTFQGFAYGLLRRSPLAFGLALDFPLWTDREMRRVFAGLGLWWNHEDCGDVATVIAALKENMVEPQHRWRDAMRMLDDAEAGRDAVRFFDAYEAARLRAGAVDFADLVPLLVHGARNDPRLARLILGQIDDLLVDEFQDASAGQRALLNLFQEAKRHLWAVGDDDQSIYGFRGTRANAIAEFIAEQQHRGRACQTHFLRENYRSARKIVEAGAALMSRHHTPDNPSMLSMREHDGIIIAQEAVDFIGCVTSAIATVRTLLEAGQGNIAILLRDNMSAFICSRLLTDAGLPVSALPNLSRHPATRFFLAALALSDGIAPAAIDLGQGVQARIFLDLWRDHGFSWKTLAIAPRARAISQALPNLLPRKAAARTLTGWQLMSGFFADQGQKAENAQDLRRRIENAFTPPKGQVQGKDTGVEVRTFHAVKGLEFDHVLLPDLSASASPGQGRLDEERRLAFVAITRARESLHVFWSGEASPFLFEAGLTAAGRYPPKITSKSVTPADPSHWSSDEITDLQEMRREGLAIDTMARELARPRDEIVLKLRNLPKPGEGSKTAGSILRKLATPKP